MGMPPISHPDLMQPELCRSPFNRAGWIFELKYDGYRGLLLKEGQDIRLLSRQGNDFAANFPELVVAAKAIRHDFALDGEMVVAGEEGHPSFYRLRKRAVATLRRTIIRGALDNPAFFMAFDLLALDDADLRPLPLLERKAHMEELIPDGQIRCVDHVETTGVAFFQAVDNLGLEGIVGKQADSPYVAGRSRYWQKVKTEIGSGREVRRYEQG